MFDFTAVSAAVVDVITAGLTIIDPTTLIGGTVAVAIVGALMVKLISRVRRLAR